MHFDHCLKLIGAAVSKIFVNNKGKERKGTLFKCLVVLALEH